MKICTEADYLQAHLSIIQRKSRVAYPILQIVLPQVVSRLKKWILSTARLDSRRLIKLSSRTGKSSLAPSRECKGTLSAALLAGGAQGRYSPSVNSLRHGSLCGALDADAASTSTIIFANTLLNSRGPERAYCRAPTDLSILSTSSKP